MNGVHVLEASCLLQVSGSKVMSQAEREEYEDKRLKMRKAMGDKLHDEAAAAEVSGGLLHCLRLSVQGHGGQTMPMQRCDMRCCTCAPI